MFKIFSKIAMRYLWRNKTYSGLNFLCLTFGLTCAIIALLYILTDFNFDKFHKNYKRLYSVESYVTYFNGSRFPKEYLSASLTNTLKEQVPEFENMARVTEREYTLVNDNKTFKEKGIYADSSIFSMFSFQIKQGDIRNTFADDNSIIISDRMAKKFFGRAACLGKSLIIKENDKEKICKVAGIFRNVPFESTLQFDFVIPFSKFLAENAWANEPESPSNQIWVLLKSNTNNNLVSNKIKNLIKTQEATLNQELFLFPLKDKRLYSYADGKKVWSEMQNVVLFGSIGFAILLIACFNFINLAIALNLRRHKEAGIKKVEGSRKSSLVFQFLGETFIITIISLAGAIMLVQMVFKDFNAMFGGGILVKLTDPSIILLFIIITLFTGLVSGLFPALYLASSNPLKIIKGDVTTHHSYSLFRQGLIIFQIAIPIVLIICIMIVNTQDKYMRNFNIGVDKDKLIVLDNTKNIQSHAEALKTELLAIADVQAVSFTNCLPAQGVRVSNEISWEGKDASEKLHFWCINSDFDYNKTVEIKMSEGRFFNPQFPSDSDKYVINNIATHVMKYNEPLGHSITLDGKKGTIIGVFKDFHTLDLSGPLVPTIIRIKTEDRNRLLVKFSSQSYAAITDKIRKVYTRYEPETPYQPRLFRDITETSRLKGISTLVSITSFVSILLACLGLFGLASFTAAKRTKEIGVRKANGATTRSVMGLLLNNYTKWVTTAFLLGLPIAFLLGKFFLNRFSFHTSMPWWAFAAGPLLVYTVALLTVSYQAYRVASCNPVKALRYE